MHKRTFTLVAAALLGGQVAAHAESKQEDAVEYRQGMMMGMAWNFGEMGAMVKGKVPFDQARFAFLAGRMATLAPMPVEAFTPDTADVKSEVKPELWKHLDDFKKRMKDLEDATAKLATVAKAGDEGATKEQFGATAKVCKGCHDEYHKKHE